MKLITRATLTAALGLAACGADANSFEVEVRDPGATGAVLKVCRSAELTLRRDGDRFVAAHGAGCEGSGEILVSFADRPPVSCPVGYVTPGLRLEWRFIVENGHCRALIDQEPAGE
ncbi:hypothetical protein GVN21_03825 [Caulobacter sp. SLTY]|uniref:hypothetical protein n=1 Tax=Caulobacter sp. SLTY TaxID=2683262 RepID=UPI00141295A8|nr:hypothetical protein [Caulobacter sp. SLTY]NBB14486.1 hypothetical protein [Caulobacter sp. SLTY]